MPPPRTYAWCRLVRDADLPTSAKAVGFVLSTYVNGDGVAYPLRGDLAVATGVSLSTLERALRALVRVGLVEVEGRRGRSRPNRYRLVAPAPVEAPAFDLAAAARKARNDLGKVRHG